MKRKVISLLLAVVMILTVMPMTALEVKASNNVETEPHNLLGWSDDAKEYNDLSIIATCDDELTPGETVKISLEVSNIGDKDLTICNLIRAIYPKNTTHFYCSNNHEYYNPGTFSYSDGTETDGCVSILSGTSVNLIYTVTIPSDCISGDYLYICAEAEDGEANGADRRYYGDTKLDIENIPERTGDITVDLVPHYKLIEPNTEVLLRFTIKNNSNKRIDLYDITFSGWLSGFWLDTDLDALSAGCEEIFYLRGTTNEALKSTDGGTITFSDPSIDPITVTVKDVNKYLDGIYADNLTGDMQYLVDGEFVKDEWIYEERRGWMYFDETGYAVKGWNYIDGNWYYFASQNLQLQVVEGYSMKTGWLNIGGIWYYFADSGAMVTGWQEIDGTWYYFYDSGEMAVSTWISDCYVDSTGAWIEGKTGSSTGAGNQTYVTEGWQQSGGKWWYQLADSSYLASTWKFIGGEWYHFDAAGWMATGWVYDAGAWYYMETSGAMKTGWLNENGTWYYLNSSGAMVTDTVVDGCTIDKNGVWVQ